MSKQGKKRGRSLCQSVDHVSIECSTKEQHPSKLCAIQDECQQETKEQNNKSTLSPDEDLKDCSAELETPSDCTTKPLKDQQQQPATSNTHPFSNEQQCLMQKLIHEKEMQCRGPYDKLELSSLREVNKDLRRDSYSASRPNHDDLLTLMWNLEQEVRKRDRKGRRHAHQVLTCETAEQLKKRTNSLLDSGYYLIPSDEESEDSSDEQQDVDYVDLCYEPDLNAEEYTQWP